MITLQFEEALINQIASMSELEKESFFEKVNEKLAKDKHEHTVVSRSMRELEDYIETLREELNDSEYERREAEERLENIQDELRDAVKLPLNQFHNKVQEIINDI